MDISDIIEKHTWVDSDFIKAKDLKNELLGLFGVNGSLEQLENERIRLNNSRNAMTPDWKCSQINRRLHTVWVAEELIKPLASDTPIAQKHI